MKKISVDRFLCSRPSAAVPPSPISHASGPLRFPAPPSLTNRARLSALSSPKSTLPGSPAWQRWPNCRRRADHPSPPHAARMPTCAPAALSHRVGCGALWRSIAAGHYTAVARRCSSRDAHARSSTMKPHIACSAGQADMAESAPCRPRCSPIGAHA
jgi:hypothetical protein